MKEGMKTAIAAISMILLLICFIISTALTTGSLRSLVLGVFLGGTFLFLVSTGMAMIFGHAGFLLTGWNTMTPEERSRYDEKKMLRFGGILIIVTSMGILLSLLSFTFGQPWLGWILLVLSLTVVFAGAVHMGRKGNIYSV